MSAMNLDAELDGSNDVFVAGYCSFPAFSEVIKEQSCQYYSELNLICSYM